MRILMTILLVTILFAGCKKDEEATTVPHHGKISSSLYPFLFNTGSYWVYKDTITNSLDSTILTNITRGTFSLSPTMPGQGSQGDEEYFNLNYLSYPTNNIYSEEIFGSIISRGHTSGGITYISTKTIGDSIYNAKIENIIDTLNIEGQSYYNVIKMRIQADSYISSNYNFYYVESIGIIKKETITGETVTNTWNLLRYRTTVKPY